MCPINIVFREPSQLLRNFEEMVLGHDTLPLGRIIFPAPFVPQRFLMTRKNWRAQAQAHPSWRRSPHPRFQRLNLRQRIQFCSNGINTRLDDGADSGDGERVVKKLLEIWSYRGN